MIEPFEHPQGWFDPETGEWTAAEPSLPAFAAPVGATPGKLSGKNAPGAEPTHPASPKQHAFVTSLLASRVVDPDLHDDVTSRVAAGLTHDDCTHLLPLLQACPVGPRRQPGRCRCRDRDRDEDWTTPEGDDDGPDQGVHRYDGGGAW